MSGAYGMVRGVLFKSPETKQSKIGYSYASVTLRVKDGGESRFWKLMAFKNAAATLMAFNEGDLVQAKGSIKCEAYTKKDNSTAVGFTMLANSVESYSPAEKTPRNSIGDREHR